MAISKNLYTRGLKQRLAGAVWYQQKGRTLVRELAASVSNPQTDTQMDNRVKLANVVAAYRANMHWMEKYAFELKKKEWSIYNAFVSANLSSNNIYLTKQDVELQAGVVAPYMFTKGSLPTVEITYDSTNRVFLSNLYVGSDYQIDANTNVANLSTELINHNAGLREFDQISFVWNVQQMVGNTPRINAVYFEMILDTADTRTVESLFGTDEIVGISTSGGMKVLSAAILLDYDDLVQGFLMCVSRDNSTSVDISTQTMVLTGSSVISQYSGAENQSKARRSYAPINPTPFLAGGYQQGQGEIVSYPSILTVAVDDGSPVSPGGVLEPKTTDFTLKVQFDEDLTSAVPASVVVELKDTEDSGSVVTADCDDYADDYALFSIPGQSGTNNISSVKVVFAGGRSVTAEFTPTPA